MKLVTYNIHYAMGQDGYFDLDRIANAVQEADIICLQEVDRYWQRSGYEDQALSIAEKFSDYAWIYGPGYDASARRLHSEPASAEERGRRRQHGNMILSKWPILSSRVLPLPKAKPKQFCQQRVAVEAVIDAPNDPIRVYSLHLCHISDTTRMPQVERLLTYLHTLPSEGATWSVEEPRNPFWEDGDIPPPYPDKVVLMGDFNFTPASQEYKRLCNDKNDLMDCWNVLGRDPNLPEQYSCISLRDQRRLRLDHIFVSSGLADRVQDGWIDRQSVGSDHYPLWVELR